MAEIEHFSFSVTPWVYGDGRQAEWRIAVTANGRRYELTEMMPRVMWDQSEVETYILAAIAEFRRASREAAS